jgi:hypothetical protein
MKINKYKKYRTRIGLDVKIYEIYEDFNIVHGVAIGRDGCPVASLEWDLNGETYHSYGVGGNDLIEVSPYEDFKMDDNVLVWDEGNRHNKSKRHFAGLDDKGNALAWSRGNTSFTADGSCDMWENCEKYEENND